MKEEKSTGPELEWGPGGRKPSSVAHPVHTRERPGWRAFQKGKPEPSKRMQRRWDSQWREYLKTMQNPQSVWENPQLSEATPWDDTKAFLTSFEQVAAACRWPRDEWVARLVPALSGHAEQAFSSLEARDREDYGKVKAAILRGDAMRRETQRQHFRQFCCQEVEDPRRMHGQLQELCCKWLKPEKNTKEQILELLILEQFLASLPLDLQSWIRASGPDSCSQAVTLVEDFLMSQREVETGKWQEEHMDSLDAAEAPLDAALGEIYKEAKQNGDGEINLPGNGASCPAQSSSSLPQKGQEVAESGLTERLTNLKETAVSLHVVEQTRAQPNQGTMFWQVLPEDDETVDSLEGLLVHKPDLKNEEEIFHFPVESERLPDQDSGGGMESHLKGEHSQCEGNGPEGTPRPAPQGSKPDVLVTAVMPKKRCESNRGQEKMQEVKAEPIKVAKSPEAGCSDTHTAHTGEKLPLFSRYSRRYCHKPRFDMKCEEEHDELQESFQLWTSHTGEKPYGCGESFHERGNLLRHQSSHTGEKNYESPDCDKSLTSRTLMSHHIGEKLHKCPVCGKSFIWRENLISHLNIHTGQKAFECPECRKCFIHRADLMRHVRTHTGEKPFVCPSCERSFVQKADLMRHLRTHTGEKPYACPNCGRSFSQRSNLFRHLRIHTGEKPFKCHDCGKSFREKRTLLSHQRIYGNHFHSLKS